MSKHTPGPWEAYHVSGAGWSVRRQYERPGYTGLAPICSMAWWQFDIPGIIDDEISGANARLIGAAPEMLRVLKGLLPAIEAHASMSAATSDFNRYLPELLKVIEAAECRTASTVKA